VLIKEPTTLLVDI